MGIFDDAVELYETGSGTLPAGVTPTDIGATLAAGGHVTYEVKTQTTLNKTQAIVSILPSESGNGVYGESF